ncbi:MAG: hypothetical protein KDB27_08270 [Planctomycetales bacterium]|nr:hypothetical protein [Planctomycetales bacterium]
MSSKLHGGNCASPRLVHFGLALITWLWIVGSLVAEVQFEYIGTHPDAVLQETEQGQTLHTLHEVSGRLFVGYGDYSADTGPIAFRSFDTQNLTFSSPLGTVDTEAIFRIQDSNGRVFALTTDPLLRDPGGYLGGPAGSTEGWAPENSLPFLHVLDFASTESMLFLSGSGGPDDIFHSVVYASSNGGSTWDLSLHANLPEGIEGGNGNFSRFYGAAEISGEVYVQQIFFRAGVAEPSTMFRFDGTGWNEHPPLLTSAGEWTYFIDPDEFKGEIVVRDAHPGEPSATYRFDGSELVKLEPNGLPDLMAWDQYVTDDTVYLLTNDRRVIASKDLVDWETIADNVPLTFRSLAVSDNSVFFGTTDSSLYRLTLVPEPSSTSLLVLLTFAVVTTNRRSGRPR